MGRFKTTTHVLRLHLSLVVGVFNLLQVYTFSCFYTGAYDYDFLALPGVLPGSPSFTVTGTVTKHSKFTTTDSVLRLHRHSIGDRDLVSTSFRILKSLQVSTNSLLQYLDEATN
ncbi:hypothetical protein L2E82_02688 [Cichorium intybus]|uniref:Uncharacterized protein n=1 Tax=Cichorium intybus TaxID=13427 RepID=A0ACB9H367_CICIN|nr:hypothetical protein L2E82_02688 [Cichorium intybus]